MKLEISFPVIGLFLSITVLLIWIRQKKVGLANEKAVLNSIVVCTLLQIFLIVTKVLIRNDDVIPSGIISICIKLSLILMACEVTAVMAYLFNDSLLDANKKSIGRIVTTVMSLAIAFFIAILNVGYEKTEELSYITGLGYDITFFICWILGILSLVISIIRKNKITSQRRAATLIWVIIWGIATLVEFIFPQIDIAGLGFVLALIAVISIAENLENYFNIGLECFQFDALIAFLKIKYLSKRKLSLLYVYIFNDANDYHKEHVIQEEMIGIIDLFEKSRDSKIFKTKTNEIVICSNNYDSLTEQSNKLKEYLDSYQSQLNYANRVDSTIIIVEDIHLANSPIDLLNLLETSKTAAKRDVSNTSITLLDNSLIEKAHEELEMLKEIDYAIHNDGVILQYQPVLSVKQDRIVSAEVLTRLKGSDSKTIMPAKFLPIAEKYGRIVELGEEILKKSSTFYNELRDQGIVLEDISINFSSYQLEDPAIINSVIDAVSENKLNPAAICVEITNGTAVRRKKEYMQNINRLVSFGITLSMTGFGSDNSNLDYILNMPANLIRLDRNFVWDAVKDERVGIILDNTIEMAHKFGMKVVAVGIENSEQDVKMIEKGVDYLQGLYIGKPMLKNDFVRYVKEKEVAKEE